MNGPIQYKKHKIGNPLPHGVNAGPNTAFGGKARKRAFIMTLVKSVLSKPQLYLAIQFHIALNHLCHTELTLHALAGGGGKLGG